MEREHERDEFQQEIHRLEAQLRQTPNVEGKGHRVRATSLIKYLCVNIHVKNRAHYFMSKDVKVNTTPGK